MRHAVVLAGGGGTRLWPASRKTRPKQLLPLAAGETLLGATVRRLAPVVDPTRVVVVTAKEHASAVQTACALPAAQVLAEPCGRNTAAAVGLAAVYLDASDPNAVLGVMPADHHVREEAGFRAALERAFVLAEAEDAIVTLGVKPTRPETGFGYLELDAAASLLEPHRVLRFVEKPDRARAEHFLSSGRFLWNSGTFFFRASRILREIERHLPTTYRALAQIGQALRTRGPEAAKALTASLYPTLESVSIDHGVMEKTTDLWTLAFDAGWSDVGAWSSLAELLPADEHGNVTSGLLVAHDAQRNVVSCDAGTLVALVGVTDLVVVQSGNAVLVIPRERAQEVREIVRQLEQRKLDAYQ
jgi:mannose-1-phosphate guanylyltransferase